MDEEELFTDLDDEVVSSEMQEEQPEEDVPYHYEEEFDDNDESEEQLDNVQNNNYQINPRTVKDSYKNNRETINRLNEIRGKNQAMPNNPTNNLASSAGREIGNKLAGKSEEEKSSLEKKTDDVAGKAASAAITGLTGGAVNGPVADAAGEIAAQLAKKQIEKKKKTIIIIASVIVTVILLFILILLAGEDDESDVNDYTMTYITGGMSDDELVNYLKYMGICTDAGTNYNDLTEEEEKYQTTADCKYALQFYKKIKEEYDEKKKECTSGLETRKNVNYPCGVELNVPLLFETLSYGKSDDELWNKRETPNQKQDIEDLSDAMIEYVHEYCYVDVGIYRNKKNVEVRGACDGCTYVRPWYENREWFYFQLSFDKYVSFLKYGTTSTHPYYTGENNREVEFGSKIKNTSINGQTGLYDHKCVGPSNSTFNYINGTNGNSSSNSGSNSDQTTTISAASSNYCSSVYCAAYNNGIAKEECRKGCEKIRNSCASKKCKGIPDSASYAACMNTCVG